MDALKKEVVDTVQALLGQLHTGRPSRVGNIRVTHGNLETLIRVHTPISYEAPTR